MGQAPKDPILTFSPNIIQDVRTIYGLEKPGRMEEAIHILDTWVKQQQHFVKQDFPSGYLERTLIATQGSIERAKKQLDKVCTLRTLIPHLFGDYDVKDSYRGHQDFYVHAALPKMTTDRFRVYGLILKKTWESRTFMEYYRTILVMFEYLRLHDYANGNMYVIDFSNVNILDFTSKLNPIEFHNMLTMVIGGYGVRIKAIHWISSSKFIDTLVTIVKQLLSAKVAGRLYVHKDLEALNRVVSKEILPVEFGGDERPLKDLHEEWLDVLSSEEHKQYMKEQNAACTDERLRRKDNFNDQYMGMPGTFRTLSVD